MAATAEPTAATDDANDDDGENSPIGRTLGKHSDGISLLLARLPLAEQVRAGEVCRMFNDGSSATLNARSSLDLSTLHSALDDEGLENILGKCPSLRTLNVSGCKKLTDEGLKCIPKCCPLLSDVNLSCLPLLTANGVETAVVDGLARSIQSLELAGCTKIAPQELVSRFSRFLELDDDEDGLNRCQG